MSACHLPLSDMIRTYSHLPYLSLFRGCIILRYVCLFQIFSLNYQQTVLYLYQQMRRNYKIKSTEKLKANLWIYLNLTKVHHLKELTSPYIISYLHFLNLNNILALPKLLPLLKLHFDLIRLTFALFFACQIYTHVHQFTNSKQVQAVYKKNGVKLFEKPRTRRFLLLENLKTQKLSSAQLLWLAQFLGNQNPKIIHAFSQRQNNPSQHYPHTKKNFADWQVACCTLSSFYQIIIYSK